MRSRESERKWGQRSKPRKEERWDTEEKKNRHRNRSGKLRGRAW